MRIRLGQTTPVPQPTAERVQEISFAARAVIPKDFVQIPVSYPTQLNAGDFVSGSKSEGVAIILEKLPVVNMSDYKFLVRRLLKDEIIVPKKDAFEISGTWLRSNAPNQTVPDWAGTEAKVYRAPNCCRWAEELYKNYGNPKLGDYAGIPGSKSTAMMILGASASLVFVGLALYGTYHLFKKKPV